MSFSSGSSGSVNLASASIKVLSNTVFLSVADLVNKAMMFIFYMIAARHLGVSRFGVLSFGIAFVTMWTVFSDLGLGIVTARELARDYTSGKLVVGAGMAIKLIAVLVVALAIVIVVRMFDLSGERIRVVYICILFVLEVAFTNYFVNVFQGLERMYYTTLTRFSQAAVLILGVLLLSQTSPAAENYAWLFVGGGFASVLTAGGITWRLLKPRLNFNLKLWKGLLRESLPLGLSVIFVNLYYWNGTTLLAKYGSDSDVGEYSAAFRIAMASLFLILSFTASLYPLFSRLGTGQDSELKRAVNRAFRYISVLALPIGGFGTVLAARIINLVYGGEYLGASMPLTLLCWWAVFAAFGSMMSYYFVAINRQVTTAWQSALSLGVNLIGNFVLIPRWQARGAAVSILLSEAAGFLFLLFMCRNTILRSELSTILQSLMRVALVLFLSVTVMIFLMKLNFYAGVLLGLLVYPLLIFSFRVLTRDDYRILVRKRPG